MPYALITQRVPTLDHRSEGHSVHLSSRLSIDMHLPHTSHEGHSPGHTPLKQTHMHTCITVVMGKYSDNTLMPEPIACIIRLHKAGHIRRELMKKVGVSEHSVRYWVRLFRDGSGVNKKGYIIFLIDC